jgi:hypothetical protein
VITLPSAFIYNPYLSNSNSCQATFWLWVIYYMLFWVIPLSTFLQGLIIRNRWCLVWWILTFCLHAGVLEVAAVSIWPPLWSCVTILRYKENGSCNYWTIVPGLLLPSLVVPVVWLLVLVFIRLDNQEQAQEV